MCGFPWFSCSYYQVGSKAESVSAGKALVLIAKDGSSGA